MAISVCSTKTKIVVKGCGLWTSLEISGVIREFYHSLYPYFFPSEQNGVEAAGENLDGWKMEGKVTSRTTHVVNSGPKRTINMLKGMVRGCWLVDQKWVRYCVNLLVVVCI